MSKNNEEKETEEVVSDDIISDGPIEDENVDITNMSEETIKNTTVYQDLYNKHLRSLADIENKKKQLYKEVSVLSENANNDFATDMIEILDTLYLSLPMIDDTTVAEGIVNTIDLFNKKLLKYNITEVPYETFDTAYHMATQEKEDLDRNKGEIIEILMRGYLHKEILLRPAMVILSK